MSDQTLIDTYKQLLETVSKAGSKKGQRLRKIITIEAAEAMREYINKEETKPIRG